MKHLKKSFMLLMLLTAIIGSQIFAQDFFASWNPFNPTQTSSQTKERLQDNAYLSTASMVRKGTAITGQTTKSPFFVFLRTDGNKALIAGRECAPGIGSQTLAQDLFNFGAKLKADRAREVRIREERAKEVLQNNEYTSWAYEQGLFYDNLLKLDGKPLDYGEFNLRSIGELTVSKDGSITGQTTQIPFYVYLRRNGDKVMIPGKEKMDSKQIKIDLSEIFEHAEPGDYLIIEAVDKEDGTVKRILKLIGGGC